ncbi:MAG: response regulator, partial [Anaerolineae bacterium]
TQENLYTQEDVSFLSTVASQSAMAVRNAQLYEQIVGFSSELEEMVEARTRDLEKALDDLTVERDRAETLYRITSELGASLELERVLQRALQLFADALGLDHGTILLVDPESGDMRLRATLDEDRRLPREGKATRWRRGVGLAGWVLQEREPVLIPDVTQDERWVQRPDKAMNVRSVLAAPLSLGGGDVLGVLTLGHPEVGYFTPEHMQLLTAATAQIAIAVNNSDLYAFITDQADQLGAALQSQQEEAAKNRAILESIADGVLVLDHNGRVLLVNPAAEELLGFSGMALEGQHFRHMLGLGETLVHRELAQALYTELRQRVEVEAGPRRSQDEAAGAVEGSMRLQAGNQVLAVNVAPLIVSLGAAPGVVAALRDISREAEVERLKNEFISTVSHELRTPMTSIKGYTDLLFLGMAGGLTDAQRNFLQIIKSNADRLTALVNDILDISRIETGRIRLTIESLDLTEIIGSVVTSFQGQYEGKDMSLVWEEPADLPEVRGDATRVTQVLTNLVGNAWHYTPEGGQVTVTAQLVHGPGRDGMGLEGMRGAEGFVRVDVADTGIGITPEDLSRIFDRFYRADHPLVQEAGGTGLGLSIVKMFVEMLGGEIWVESQVGIGSTFSFTLPLTSTDLPEPSVDLLTTDPTTVVSRRPKILVVEDDRDLALQVRRQLESDGYQVLLAGSGEDALWLAREEQPQLITLDIMLPDLDGFAVLERLRAHPITAPIPVVVVSVLTKAGLADESSLADSEKFYSLGAVDYVVKPFEEEKLLRAVRQALSGLDLGQGAATAKVLVVDDDPDILALLDEALTFHGYQVLRAANGHQALERVAEDRPDLLLLDIKMPGMDGYEVIRRLKADVETSAIPIIVITASPVDKERDRVRVLGMGASQYVTKPLSIENLIDEIKRAMAAEGRGSAGQALSPGEYSPGSASPATADGAAEESS